MNKKIKIGLISFFAISIFAGLTKTIENKDFDVAASADASNVAHFVNVNPNHHNLPVDGGARYEMMLHYDVPFASVDKRNENIAGAEYEAGNKILYNGTPIKDIPNFVFTYFKGGTGEMLWFKIPTEALKGSNGYANPTIFVPQGTTIFDKVTNEDVTVRLLNNNWEAVTSFIGVNVNTTRNNSYVEKEDRYETMLRYDFPLYESSQPDKNLVTASDSEVGSKMTLNGVPVKNIPNFMASYYLSGTGPMFWFKVPAAYNVATTGYQYPTITIPKDTAFFTRRTTTKEDVTLYLINDCWCPTFGSDVTLLTKRPTEVANYGMDGGYRILDADQEGYTGGVSRVLKLDTSTNGVTAATFDFSRQNINTAQINSITFKVKFDFSTDITGTEFRITNTAGTSWVVRFAVDKAVSGTWYTITLKSNNVFETDIPNATITDALNFSRFGSKLGMFMAGLRIKAGSMGMTFGDVIVDSSATPKSSFVQVLSYNNNKYNEAEHVYATMIEFSNNFAETSKASINLANSSTDLGNKMTLNGVAVKDIPGFFVSYYYATDINRPLIWFKVPEEYMVCSNGYKFITLNIPAETLIYDAEVSTDIELYIFGTGWVTHVDDTKWSASPEPIDEYDYSFAIVGDPQDVNISTPQEFHKIYDWIVDNHEEKKIAHTIGLGDITNNDTEAEWSRARDSFDQLEAEGMTHTQVRGNHDSQGKFESFFSNDEYYCQGVTKYNNSILNHYRTLKVQNIDYLILALDYGPSNSALDWANKVVEDHPHHNVIVVTHGYLFRDGTTLGYTDELTPSTSNADDINNGEEIWNNFVKKHANITMVLSGHIYCDNILVTEAVGDHGNKITQVLIDPQQMDRSGTRTGLVAMFYFSNGGRNIQVEYYATILQAYEITSPVKKFTVNVVESVANQNVEDFCVTYLGKGTIDTTDIGFTGNCLTAYSAAKAAFNALSNEDKSFFLTDAEYADMVLRLEAWARANGEVFDTSTGSFTAARSSNVLSLSNSVDYSLILVAAISGIALTIYICKQRKKSGCRL